ncbi:MAG: monovalent cation/H(+) antiporter subunit G [Planctomycetes bacterium]|nr:monovalent cation/H(+) antiporter subunit G [Planctomycetota bacterium]
MTGTELLTAVLLGAGAFVSLTSALGVLRMPDFFSRIHPAGENESLGQTLILAGLIVAAGPGGTALKLVLVWAFLMITAPAATHALTRAAWKDGRRPWSRDDAPDAADRGPAT